MSQEAVDRCHYATARLRVGPWPTGPDAEDGELAGQVASILTAHTTAALPPQWRGDFTVDRARDWIAERDAESPTLLVTEVGTGEPIGLVILAALDLVGAAVEVRIGYVIAERAWGRGYATELVAGLVDWARDQPAIRRLSGGVEVTNGASIRVLERAGFVREGSATDGVVMYRLDVPR